MKEGGILLCQYNTSNQLGQLRSKISPYPFVISRNRVTEENAKVNFLAPNHFEQTCLEPCPWPRNPVGIHL